MPRTISRGMQRFKNLKISQNLNLLIITSMSIVYSYKNYLLLLK